MQAGKPAPLGTPAPTQSPSPQPSPARGEGEKFLRVVACPHPFTAVRVEYRLAPAQSLAEVLREVQPEIDRWQAHVWVNDAYIRRELWASTYPPPGAEIAIRVLPRGPFGKLIGSIFIAIAAIAAAFLVPGLLGLTGMMAGLIGGLSGMAVSFLGNLVLNALIPPPANPGRPSLLAGGQESPTYALSGGSNQANKYGPVPVLLGRHKVFPNYGAEPYTEVVGNDQYLRLYFIWGFGPLEIRDLKIGETALAAFEGLEVEHRNLTYIDPEGAEHVYGDEPLTLYTNDVHEEDLSIQLERNEPNVRTSQAGAQELSVDVTCPSLYHINPFFSGVKEAQSVWVEIAYRLTGSEDPWVVVENLQVRGATSSAVRQGFRWKVEAGQYDVRLKRTSPGADDNYTVSVSYWTALRTIKNSNPVLLPGLAATVMRLKASNELNGVVQTFSGIARSICLDWDSLTGTWTPRATQNPAALFRHLAQGPHRQVPFLDAELNLAKLQYWHEYCETQGWQYNKVIDYKVDFWEVLAEIAAAGRAGRTWEDSRLSVIIDEPQEFTIGPAFTPRNTNNFKANIAYPDLPHAFRVPFKNEDRDFADDERVVLDDGYQIEDLDAWGEAAPELPPAGIFQELPLPGITSAALIFKHARYHIACARLRFETQEFDAHPEALVATRGDRIKFAHDVLLVGLAWGRVKSLVVDEAGYLAGVVLDEICPMEAGTTYCLRFSREDNSTLLCLVNTWAGEYKILELQTPIPGGEPWPQAGNIFMFGESGLEAIDLIIKASRPNANLGAKLTTVAYDANIYLADQGEIPAHDPGITVPPEWWVPIIDWVRSDGTVLYRAVGGSWISRILVTVRQISALSEKIQGLEGQYWRSDSPTAITAVGPVPLENGEISLMPVEDGVSYDFRLRYVKRDGSRGPWTETQTHTVEGKTAPPENVTGLNISQTQAHVTFSWDPNPDLDLAGYELRYGPVDCTWEEAAIIIKALLATKFSTPELWPGKFDFLIKAVDTSGNYSVLATRQTWIVAGFYKTLSKVDAWPLWPGYVINMVRDPSTGWLYPGDGACDGDDFYVFDNIVCGYPPGFTRRYDTEVIDLISVLSLANEYVTSQTDPGNDIRARAWAKIDSQLFPGQEDESEFEDLSYRFDYKLDAAEYWASFKPGLLGGPQGLPWKIGGFTGRYAQFFLYTGGVEQGHRVIKNLETHIDQIIEAEPLTVIDGGMS